MGVRLDAAAMLGEGARRFKKWKGVRKGVKSKKGVKSLKGATGNGRELALSRWVFSSR
jgi:hypothetical protein